MVPHQGTLKGLKSWAGNAFTYVGDIVGAAAGGLAFVLLMIVIAVCAVKKMKKASTPSKSP